MTIREITNTLGVLNALIEDELPHFFCEVLEEAVKVLKPMIWHNLIENPNDVPPKQGWYYCWLKNDNIDYGMDLYYYPNHTFIDNRRKNVFELYDVMGTNLDANGVAAKEKMYKDDCVDRTAEVVAWCECPSKPEVGFDKLTF